MGLLKLSSEPKGELAVETGEEAELPVEAGSEFRQQVIGGFRVFRVRPQTRVDAGIDVSTGGKPRNCR